MKMLFLNHVGLSCWRLLGGLIKDLKVPMFLGPCWALGGHVGAMLGLCETYVGQFLGPCLRAKNSVIFSAKKMGSERPMLGLF